MAKAGKLEEGNRIPNFCCTKQAIRTNVIKAKIDNTQEQSKCRMCGEKDETVNHLISECSKMAQREYERRHDWVGRRVHWDVSKKYGIVVNDKWYQHEPGSVIENDKSKILWDFTVHGPYHPSKTSRYDSY